VQLLAALTFRGDARMMLQDSARISQASPRPIIVFSGPPRSMDANFPRCIRKKHARGK